MKRKHPVFKFQRVWDVYATVNKRHPMSHQTFTRSQLMSKMELINKLYPVVSGRLNIGMDVKATISNCRN